MAKTALKPAAKSETKRSAANPPLRHIGGKPIPTYPLGPSTLEILVMAMVRGGQLVVWNSEVNAPDGRLVIEDDADVDLEQAKARLFARQIAPAAADTGGRTVAIRGSVELTEHALERAHRAVVLLVEDRELPPMFLDGWISGKIGVPKGSPAIRTVNLHRPER